MVINYEVFGASYPIYIGYKEIESQLRDAKKDEKILLIRALFESLPQGNQISLLKLLLSEIAKNNTELVTVLVINELQKYYDRARFIKQEKTNRKSQNKTKPIRRRRKGLIKKIGRGLRMFLN